jgi:hypothetical protein
MNTKLVESLLQAILSLSAEERSLLEEKLFFDLSEASTRDLILLAQTGGNTARLRIFNSELGLGKRLKGKG